MVVNCHWVQGIELGSYVRQLVLLTAESTLQTLICGFYLLSLSHKRPSVYPHAQPHVCLWAHLPPVICPQLSFFRDASTLGSELAASLFLWHRRNQCLPSQALECAGSFFCRKVEKKTSGAGDIVQVVVGPSLEGLHSVPSPEGEEKREST